MMITINLKPGLKRKRAGSPLGGLKERVTALASRVKDPMLLGAAATWLVVLGGLGAYWTLNARQLSAREQQLELSKSEHRRFKNFIAQKRKQELIRDSLLAQIGVIRNVDRDRYVWAHVLDEVAQALPAYTWLVDIAAVGAAAPGAPPNVAAAPPAAAAADSAAGDSLPPAMTFRINGRTVDIQAYTKFLRQLEASPWIENVQPLSVTTVIEKERPVTAFTVAATFSTADSAYIRTVPLDQSVR
ncbi:MAG: PilN domain-containing protein [Gemmatimonadales bacterium]|jgi:Tfp pilus assembly protein PilN|nr:PilN domain-containing protein [Gemmatimonadales bacterium]